MNTKQETLDLVLTGLWHAFIVGLAVVVISLLSGCTTTAQRQELVSDMPTKVLCYNVTEGGYMFSPQTYKLMMAELNRRAATCDGDAGSTYTIK